MITVAGSHTPATAAPMGSVTVPAINGLAMDPSGNIYFSSAGGPGSNAVYEVGSDGIVKRVAGGGAPGFAGDGGPATAAQLNGPTMLAVGRSGDLFILDAANYRVRKVSPTGVISTVAGNGGNSDTGDGGPATSAGLQNPYAIALDGSDNLYIATASQVREVTANGNISSVSGVASTLAMCVDGPGNVYFRLLSPPTSPYGVSKRTPNGVVTTVFSSASAVSMAADGLGNLYITETSNTILKIDQNGVITTVAGGGSGGSGDGGPATQAVLTSPNLIAANALGDFCFVEGSRRIRKVTRAGTISTVGETNIGDGGPASFAILDGPGAMARDALGNTYVVEGNACRVRKIDVNGVISTFAGNGVCEFNTTTGVPAISQPLINLESLAADNLGNVYISAYGGGLYKVDVNGILTSVSLPPSYVPYALALGPDNTLYASSTNCVIKRPPGGSWTPVTLCGQAAGFSGDGGPAASALISGSQNPIATDTLGNLYIGDIGNSRIRKVDTNGIITTVASASGCNVAPPLPPSEPYPPLCKMSSLAPDNAGDVFVGEGMWNAPRILQVSPAGVITTLVDQGYLGGGPGEAYIQPVIVPGGMVSDGGTGLFVVDTANCRVVDMTPPSQSALNASVSHSQAFQQGTSGSFTISAQNIASQSALSSFQALGAPLAASSASVSAAASGTVTVTASLSTGLPISSLSGAGWACTNATCTNSVPVAAGGAYPPISALVNLPPGAPDQMTLKVTVSGGGSPTSGAQDTVDVAAPRLNISHLPASEFRFGQIDASYAVTVSNAGAAATNGAVTATESLAPGLTLVSMAGTGWNCGGNACARSDSLAGGAAYPPITVTVNVAAAAASPLVSMATVTGGGSPNAAAADSTVPGPAHPPFFAGEITLSGDLYYLNLSNVPFGYYHDGVFPWIDHLDLGWEYFVAAQGGDGAYFWDLTSQHWWYTSRAVFPYLYDFTLGVWLYYFPDARNPGRYTANPRFFANMTTGQIFTM
jgi:uncharacterized repeat protein (TIGR01451 family)